MSAAPNRVFPILVGSGRSGTTLFRNILDSSAELAVTHEAHFVAPLARRRHRYGDGGSFDVPRFLEDLYVSPNFLRQGIDRDTAAAALRDNRVRDYAAAVRIVLGLYADADGKSLYGDKTPGYVTQIPLLGSLFPEARFVHIIRDGRDVAMSYVDRKEWGPSTIAEGALYWSTRVARGRRAGAALGSDRYREFRYEDMVDDAETTTRELCAFLDLEYDAKMLRFHERSDEFIATTKTPEAFAGLTRPVTRGMRDWRSDMAADDVVLFEAIAGDLLSSLGYETVGIDPGAAVRARVAIARIRWQVSRVAARLRPLVRRLRLQ